MSLLIHVGSDVCLAAGATLHAGSGLRKKGRKTSDTRCGKRGQPIGLDVKGRPGTAMTVLWPPYAADATDWGYERCRDCMKAAPGKPIRPPFALL